MNSIEYLHFLDPAVKAASVSSSFSRIKDACDCVELALITFPRLTFKDSFSFFYPGDQISSSESTQKQDPLLLSEKKIQKRARKRSVFGFWQLRRPIPSLVINQEKDKRILSTAQKQVVFFHFKIVLLIALLNRIALIAMKTQT